MSWLINVPTKESKIPITCRWDQERQAFSVGADGFCICVIGAHKTEAGMADEIARALTEMRDIGFEQGRAYVRRALGVKPRATTLASPVAARLKAAEAWLKLKEGK